MIPKRMHAQTNIGEETIQVYFRVNRSVRCTLLGVGGVYLEHTTRTIRNDYEQQTLNNNNSFLTVTIY